MADELYERWRERYEAATLRDDTDFDTLSSVPLEPLYGPQEDIDPDIGVPGEYPFTRGIYPTGYRGRLWTMRQFAGFGAAEDTNRRFKYLLAHGQASQMGQTGQLGLSVAFDMPTLMGLDSDDTR